MMLRGYILPLVVSRFAENDAVRRYSASDDSRLARNDAARRYSASDNDFCGSLHRGSSATFCTERKTIRMMLSRLDRFSGYGEGS
jgi:hypothetical protein